MRVAFFDPESDELTNNRKGHLFESLAKRLADQAGYRDVVLRAKHASLEYDLEGSAKLHGARLAGEAKAHDAAIPGKDVAAFVGKVLPLAVEGRVDALFISTSPFTPDARDYLESALNSGKLAELSVELRTLAGDEIHDFLVENAGYASSASLENQVKGRYEMEMLDAWLVVTQNGDFVACSCGPDRIAAPTAVAFFQTDGTPWEPEAELFEQIQAQLEDIGNLELASEGGTSLLAERVERLPSVAGGVGWFDYKFPTPAECFVGRDDVLDRLQGAIEEMRAGGTALRAIQLLARSGVGKSSLLLKHEAVVGTDIVVTVDGRNLRVPGDVRLLVAELVNVINGNTGASLAIPASLDEAQLALTEIGRALSDTEALGLIQVDQFESALSIPGVYAAIVDLVQATTSEAIPLVWVFARKSDVAVTFDEGAEIDLRRLNELSVSIGLEDFTPPEGQVLLDRLSVELGQVVTAELAEAISTFSGGFPWLHKRLCSHVITMQTQGVAQRDLVLTGLRAEDLFEEDLAGLTQQDRGILKRIAAHLPATASELARHLEADVGAGLLTDKLNEFLDARLLRLSGDVYDTYNDVFKTYLVTNRVPFETRYVFRAAPRATIELLREISQVGPMTLSRFHDHIGGNRIAILNKLRELRLLGLIDPRPGRVALSTNAQAAFDNDTLGQLLRDQLRANALTVSVLDLLSAGDDVALEDVVALLQRDLPHVEVTDDTWTLYAKQLASWLHFASLALVEGETLRRREVPADESLRGRDFYRGAFAPGTFLPSVRPGKVVELLGLLGSGETTTSHVAAELGQRDTPGLLRDAQSLELIEREDDVVRPGGQGRMLLESGRSLSERDVAQIALTRPNVKALVEAANPGPLDANHQREVMSAFGSAQWEDGTWGWRLGILRSWLVASGLVSSSRGGLRAVGPSE